MYNTDVCKECCEEYKNSGESKPCEYGECDYELYIQATADDF